MKILTIVGARPQFVKAAVLSRLIKNHDGVTEVIIHTGQHFDANMSEIFFHDMDIPVPNYKLDINGVGHGEMTGRMMAEIEAILKIEIPDWVLVYGDTNSTLAGALAAKKMHFKVAHVEAGLRSFNMRMPEEINRILTDRISDVLFCPTKQAEANLSKEGFANFHLSIRNVGDIMYDAALHYTKRVDEMAKLPAGLTALPFALVTIHRAENTDDLNRLQNIINALNRINQEVNVVLPIHPRTRAILKKSNIKVDFTLIDPVGYFDMLQLIINSRIVLTDSGGLQKEAYFFKKFCITLRNETEWVELVENGYNVCVGADEERIIHEFNKFSEIESKKTFSENLYGTGNAGEMILSALLENDNEAKF